MKISIWIFAILSCVAIVTGCHHRPNRRRRKRSSVGDLTVNTFFPTCIQSERNASGDLASTIDTWNGPVSLVVFHSVWYERVNQTCGGDDDTAQCWEDAATEILLPESPTLPAVQVCIGLYNGTYGAPGRRKKRDTGETYPVNSPLCPNISRETYAIRLRPYLVNDTVRDEEEQGNRKVQSNFTDDVAFTVQNIDDVLKFAQGDLYCPNCTCDDLADAKKYFGNFEFPGKNCSSCWFTRFATSLRDDSPYKDIVSQITFEEANFTISNPCPGNTINLANEVVLEEVLGMTVSCQENEVHVEIRSFGLVAHGYRRVDEVFVTGANASTSTNDTISDQCVAYFKPGTNKEITVISFGLQDCNPVELVDSTHSIFKFVVKNKLPERDLYENEIQRQRISMSREFTCAYPL